MCIDGHLGGPLSHTSSQFLYTGITVEGKTEKEDRSTWKYGEKDLPQRQHYDGLH